MVVTGKNKLHRGARGGGSRDGRKMEGWKLRKDGI